MERIKAASLVLLALKHIKLYGPIDEGVGICTNVDDLLESYQDGIESSHLWHEERHAVFTDWDDPEATGCEVFPIAGGYPKPATYLWYKGVQADARWRLLDRLIEHFTSIAEEAE